MSTVFLVLIKLFCAYIQVILKLTNELIFSTRELIFRAINKEIFAIYGTLCQYDFLGAA